MRTKECKRCKKHVPLAMYCKDRAIGKCLDCNRADSQARRYRFLRSDAESSAEEAGAAAKSIGPDEATRAAFARLRAATMEQRPA